VYNIIQDNNGFIWIGTGEGLCRYDGMDFAASAEFDSLPVDIVNVSYADSLGKLWFGFNNGEVWSYDGNYFTPYLPGSEVAMSITGITQSYEHGIIVATQNRGLFSFDERGKLHPFHPGFSNYIISTIHIQGTNLLIGAQEGLFIYDLTNSEDSIPLSVEDLSYIKIQTIKNAYNDNSFWIGTEDAGLYLLTLSADTLQLTSVGKGLGLSYEKIQDVEFDSDSNLWVSTFSSGLLKVLLDPVNRGSALSVDRYGKKNGFPTDFVKCVFKDREKNLWIGTYGEGFAVQTNQPFEFMHFDDTGHGKNILSLAKNNELLWLGGESGIMQLNKSTGETTLINNSTLPNDKVTSLYYRDGILWVGTGNNGVLKRDKGSGRFTTFHRESNSISNSVNYITGDADNIYIATKNGIFIENMVTGKKYHYNTLNGLPHNDVEHLFLDSENRLLFATRTNGIYEINEKGEVEEFFTVGKYELDFNCITQDVNGNIWVGTYGQGIFIIMPDSVVNLTVKDGIKSNYCYSIISADSNYIWSGHRIGLTRINIHSLVPTVYDSDNGIKGDCNQNACIIDNDRILYFGTSDGLISYDIREGRKEHIDPQTNMLKVIISDKEYDFREPIVLPYSAYKLRIEFIGLLYSDPEAVTYQYKLEGYDLDWSEVTTDRSVVYPRIEDGEYTFLLKSYGTDGTTDVTPVSFTLRVKLPVWKTWWFITLLVIILILSVVVIIKYRERKQKQIQEYLEQRLDERTREVVEQKEEIEIKNRDITDSINYAQRIQSSILPPIKKLQQNFSGSFIFYQPRDIVSGDFYWFDKIGNNKFVIVCADSTGHGVPGAFMSMIGTTLIKDISIRAEVNSPSEILRFLDSELRSTLNQNIETSDDQSNDGMDIIVCEIDVKTNYMRYASAMRPMIVYRGGEQIYIKGSRSSVGGHYDKEDKIFKDEGIQLDKGDLIYMFSDGYPDQFGGPIGKKFKMVRLKNLLRDIHQKPMEEQYEYVKSTFNLWKEEYDQVDDVLFMGIKI
jgi:ligand-binding sensor domain-containing protein/serine phosphatase RsbU (regulator of sigma subunit)